MPSPSALLSSLPPPSLPHASVRAGRSCSGHWWWDPGGWPGTRLGPRALPASARHHITANSLLSPKDTPLPPRPSLLQMLPMTDDISSACCRWNCRQTKIAIENHINRPHKYSDTKVGVYWKKTSPQAKRHKLSLLFTSLTIFTSLTVFNPLTIYTSLTFFNPLTIFTSLTILTFLEQVK